MANVTAIQQQAPAAHEPGTLVEKLAAVMAAVERVPKTGWNDFHKYHYATEADLSDAVRSNMARYGVMLIPSVDKLEWREIQGKNGPEKVATLTVRFTATDGKDKVEFTIIGEGQDRGDKATYKAMTGATKYALLKLFLIPTGDDPEKDEDEHPRAAARPAPRQQAARSAAAPTAPPTAAQQQKADPPKPPPYVAKLWERVSKEFGETAKAEWTAAATRALGENPKPSNEWTAEDAAAVERVLFDVPF